MKKAYVKPMLSKESFSLTESVATGCGMDTSDFGYVTSNSIETCTFIFDGEELFTSSCPSEADYDMFCYNGMTGGLPIFRS